jgi:hypothetical protein
MRGIDPRSDGELLLATATEPEAFAVFYRRHVRGLLAFFRRRVASTELALDLTAETFAAALEASPRYQPRPEPARGWLYGIAWNKLHEAQRRGRAEDVARRALGMAPIVLTDEGIERIERPPGRRSSCSRTCLPISATLSTHASSTSSRTTRTRRRCAARRAWCASASAEDKATRAKGGTDR